MTYISILKKIRENCSVYLYKVCTHAIVLFSRTCLNSLFISKMGETVSKVCLKLRYMVSTIYFCREISHIPDLLRKLKISVCLIIAISFSLSYLFKDAHCISLFLAFWYFIYLSEIINKNLSEIASDSALQILKWKSSPRS